MAMLGKIEEIIAVVHPASRLRQGLELLQACLAGRFAEMGLASSSLSPGTSARVDLDGDALYMLIQCYKPKPRQEGRFEAHARYTDLQFLLSGREFIELLNVHAFPTAAVYDEMGTAYFPMGNDAHSRLLLQAGEVAVLLPQDAHAPCLQLEHQRDELIRKIVVKILDAHLTDSPGKLPSPVSGAATRATKLGGVR